MPAFLIAFALYAVCAYPTIAPRDSPDLAAAALSLGVAHPPGYPLYVMLGKAWLALLPWGNPAYRLNLMSVAAGAGATAVLYLYIRKLWGKTAAWVGWTTLVSGASLWKFSLLEEMYSIQALFICLLLYLSHGPRQSLKRRMYLSALIFGLGLVNHQTLILLAPGLAVFWIAALKKERLALSALARTLPLLAAGVALYAPVFIRLKSMSVGLDVITRSVYGSWTLSAQFSRPWSLGLAGRLLGYFFSGLDAASSTLALALAAWGLVRLCRENQPGARPLVLCWGLIFLASGPGYFLLTRFDVSGWVGRSVLKSAFIMPSVIIAIWAARGAAALGRFLPVPLAAALIFAASLDSRKIPFHRDDFSAYDYAKDLRRSINPRGAAIVAGDTAFFSLKYLELARSPDVGRALISSMEKRKTEWLENQLRARPVYVVGLSETLIQELGLSGNPHHLWPSGLAQRVAPSPAPMADSTAWRFLSRRPSFAASVEEPYARDVAFSYAYAHYLTGKIYESMGAPDFLSAGHFYLAAILDEEDYKLALVPL